MIGVWMEEAMPAKPGFHAPKDRMLGFLRPNEENVPAQPTGPRCKPKWLARNRLQGSIAPSIPLVGFHVSRFEQ